MTSLIILLKTCPTSLSHSPTFCNWLFPAYLWRYPDKNTRDKESISLALIDHIVEWSTAFMRVVALVLFNWYAISENFWLRIRFEAAERELAPLGPKSFMRAAESILVIPHISQTYLLQSDQFGRKKKRERNLKVVWSLLNNQLLLPMNWLMRPQNSI